MKRSAENSLEILGCGHLSPMSQCLSFEASLEALRLGLKQIYSRPNPNSRTGSLRKKCILLTL